MPALSDAHARDVKREALELASRTHADSDPDEIVKAAKRYESYLLGDDVVA